MEGRQSMLVELMLQRCGIPLARLPSDAGNLGQPRSQVATETAQQQLAGSQERRPAGFDC